MVRLPDYRSGGEASGFASKRRGVSQGDLDSGAIGKGLTRLGKVAAYVGADMKEDESALDVMRADAHRKKLMLEHERTYENDPNYEKYGETFDVASNAIRDESSALIRDPKLREKFKLQASMSDEGIKDGLLKKGVALKDQAREVEVEGILEQNRARYIDPKATPEQREQARKDIDAHIALAEQSGLLKPQAAYRVKQKYSKQLAVDDVATRIMVEPEKVLEDFELLGSGGILPPDASGPEFTTKRGQTMRTISSVGGAKFTVNANVADRVAGLVADLEAAGIEIKGEQSGGYNDRNIAGTNRRSLHADGLAIDVNWSENARGTKGKIDPKLAREIAAKHGAKWGGDWNNPDPMHFEFRDGSKPRPVKERGLTQYAGLTSKGTLSDATEEPAIAARKADLISRYGALDPQQRLEVMAKARQATTVRLEGQRQELKNMLDDDVASIEATGIGRQGIDLETAAKVLEPNQIRTYQLNRQKAEMTFKGSEGYKDMTPEQWTERMSALEPIPGEDGYAMKADVYKTIKEKIAKEKELRQKDPAFAVDQTSEVQTAIALATKAQSAINAVDGGQFDTSGLLGNQNEVILDARIKAQEARGIPPLSQRVITKAEAEALIPDLGNTEGKAALEALRSAAATAEQKYGKFGRRAFDDAIKLSKLNKNQDDMAAGVLAKMVRGETVTQRDMNQMQMFRGISFADRFMSQDAESLPITNPDSPALSQTNTNLAAENAVNAMGAANQKPNEAQLKWALEDPKTRASVFDRLFGPGAFARAAASVQSQK